MANTGHLPSICIVILNTDRRDDTLACIESLERSTYANKTVVVLDNKSKDGSVEAIRARFPAVTQLSLEKNLGYAGNNNVGIRYALERKADWILVLNEDTELDPACLAEMVAAGEADKRIGIVGPMVYHADEPTVIQSAGGVMGQWWESHHIAANETDDGRFTSARDVEWVSGCAIMLRREVIEQVGPLDERFFYYWEETEWCLRSRRGGWRIVHAPAAKLWHKGVKRDYQPKPSVGYYNVRNRLLMMQKHQAPPQVWAKVLLGTTKTIVSYTVKPRWRDKREHRDAMVRGLTDFMRGRWGQMPPR